MLKFKGKGLKTAAGAQARLHDIESRITSNSKAFVAYQDGLFFPVVALSDQDAFLAFDLASDGIYALKV